MRKSWQFLPKILSGEKTIESRWYRTKRTPWGQVKPGDTIYFKNSGAPVTVQAQVRKVLQYQELTPRKILTILRRFGRDNGIGPKEIPLFYKLFKNKRYCLLIFLENPRQITPFKIKKSGFSAMSAWISVKNINMLKLGYAQGI